MTSLLTITACANQPTAMTGSSASSDTKKPFRNVDHSAAAYDATVSKGQVSYQCQSKKSVTVTYGFDKKGKPTYAMALLEGKKRFMPLNFQRSDHVDTTFGDDNSHRLGTDYMDSSNYQQKSILITNPGNQIIFKNCFPK